MAATNSELGTWYNFLLAQMSAESYLNQWLFGPRSLEEVLRNGNNNEDVVKEEDFKGATRMTNVQVEQFKTEWEIIDHHANDQTGFSATLLRSRTTGEYTLSFRSTEFLLPSQGGHKLRDAENRPAILRTSCGECP